MSAPTPPTEETPIPPSSASPAAPTTAAARAAAAAAARAIASPSYRSNIRVRVPLPPHLAGAVSRPPVPAMSAQKRTLFLTVGILVCGFVFPFAYLRRHNNTQPGPGHFHSPDAMSQNSVSRGAFVNSGSKDVGPDSTFFRKQVELREGKQANRPS